MEYQMKSELLVTRFLIEKKNQDSSDLESLKILEIKVFKRAINHLRNIESAEHILGSPPPRVLNNSNVVLVDIFEIKENKYTEGVHTVCLWKKTGKDLLIIDPSNYTFSERLLKPLEKQFSPEFEFDAKKHVGDKFYESLQQGKIKFENPNLNGTDVNKDYRDCIDIAVKIAFSLNLSQRVANDLSTIESRIDYLSNQKKVNSDLLQGGSEQHIGWLQNSEACQREEVVRLLFENKDYIELVTGVEDIDTLQWLNFMRLRLLKKVKSFYGYQNQDDLIKLIKEAIKLNTSKLTLDQFSKYSKDWTNILENESKIKKSKEELKSDLKIGTKLKQEKSNDK